MVSSRSNHSRIAKEYDDTRLWHSAPLLSNSYSTVELCKRSPLYVNQVVSDSREERAENERIPELNEESH